MKHKNIKSLKHKNKSNLETLSIETLLKKMEDIEISLTEKNLTIRQQIIKLKKAKKIYKLIKEKLSEVNTQITIIK